jgi:hypothetical protein
MGWPVCACVFPGVEKLSSHHFICNIPLMVLRVPCQHDEPFASATQSPYPESLPRIVSKQDAAARDKATDHDGRGSRPGHALRLPPCRQVVGYRHGCCCCVWSSKPDGLSSLSRNGYLVSMFFSSSRAVYE